jgi:hypothetical protein
VSFLLLRLLLIHGAFTFRSYWVRLFLPSETSETGIKKAKTF